MLAVVLTLAVAALAGCAQATPPKSGGRTPFWIDVDPMIGEAGRDVSGAFALVQAFNSDVLEVRGVSAVFGEGPLVRTWPITQDIVDRFGPASLRPWRGAAGPHERQAPTEASEALATALRKEPLVIVALGPLTNIASALARDPALARRIVRVVALTGAHETASADETADAQGPPDEAGPTGTPRRHDRNVALDVEAARVVLDSGVPLTLAPPGLASSVWITEDDLDRLAAGPAAARFLAEGARSWLHLWTENGAAPGFPPYQALAVDLAASPDGYGCVEGVAAIETSPDGAPDGASEDQEGARLVVRDGTAGRLVTYCHTPDAAFKDRLLHVLAPQVGSGLAGG